MILIAIGANLPDQNGRSPQLTCADAVEALRGLARLRLVAVSPWHVTAADPPSDQPNYINGVARLAGQADPAELLALLHGIERRAGRVRGLPNAARVLDLDIVAIDDLVRDTPDPILPHPRAHLRRFVLEPLAEVAPDWVHPRLGVKVAALLAGLG